MCHHDGFQSNIDRSKFSANVKFTSRDILTGWGRVSVINAGLLAIQELMESTEADWFVLLSAADYPIAPADKLIEFLGDSTVDAYMDVRPLHTPSAQIAATDGTHNTGLDHFSSPGNVIIKSKFYLSPEIWLPIIRSSPRLRLGRFTFRPSMIKSSIRKRGINIYYGDHWFMANRRAARILTDDSPIKRFLLRHYRFRAQVDESFYQTMLMSSGQLSICLDNKRFVRWNGGGAHPALLSSSDMSDAFQSGSFFARKFAIDSAALDCIDHKLALQE